MFIVEFRFYFSIKNYFLFLSNFLINNHNLAIPTHTIAAKNVGPIIKMSAPWNRSYKFIQIFNHQLANKRKINITASIENIGNCHHLDLFQIIIQNMKVIKGIMAKQNSKCHIGSCHRLKICQSKTCHIQRKIIKIEQIMLSLYFSQKVCSNSPILLYLNKQNFYTKYFHLFNHYRKKSKLNKKV